MDDRRMGESLDGRIDIEFVSRYDVLGWRDHATMCKGHCDGCGVYPFQLSDPEATPYERQAWQKNHQRYCSWHGRIRTFFSRYWSQAFERCDGWHFIKCEAC